jgi:ABC-type glycerol-3-phosphate transport system substrate-binding protein
MTSHSKRLLAAITGCLVLVVGLTGCLRDPNAGSRNGGSGGGEAIADNNTVDNDKKVEILGAFGGAEKASFVKSLQEFQQRTGITIEYVDSSDFTTIIKTRVQGGSEPGVTGSPYVERFGDSSMLLVEVELERQIFQKFGSFALGAWECSRANGDGSPQKTMKIIRNV